MNLRIRGILLSALPLLITLLLAVPLALTQLGTSAALDRASRSDALSQLAHDVEEGALDIGNSTRQAANGRALGSSAYDRAIYPLKANLVLLQQLADTNGTFGATTRVTASAFAFLQLIDGARFEIRRNHEKQALAQLAGIGYSNAARNLRQSVRAFDDKAHADELSGLAAVDRLWKSSLLLLIAGIAAMALTSLLLLHYSGRAVSGILELGRKSERYQRGEPLGAPSTRHDELGQLDAALHELVAAQNLRESQLKRYRLLADVTHDIILFIDRLDLTIVDANVAALAAYGYEYDELVGLPTSILHAADDPIDSATIALSDTTAGLSYEGTHRRSDGVEFPVEVHARTADVEGRLTIVKTIRDISERRHAAEQVALALDEAIEASRLKSEFVATMSHEIRTPMHGVIGMSELLLDTPLAERQREYATTVHESARALLAIIDDILDFSKLEANKIELETVAFDPGQVVAGVINLVRAGAHQKGISLRSNVSAHVPPAVRGDPTRLRQILMNLVGNAVKFTTVGTVTVTTSVEREDTRSVTLLLSIQDTGIGIAPEAREHLFEAFVQGDGSTTRRFGGTGLGLSISQRLAELMGGRIWLGEHDGPGSTFCFAAKFERSSVAATPLTPATNALRVLVLDDEHNARDVLESMLLSWGMHCTTRASIETARTELQSAAAAGSPFAAILIDYVLPRDDGLAFAEELGARPEYGSPARILISAFDAVGRKEAALAAGCVAFLPKPVDPSTLYEVLHGIGRAAAASPAETVGATRRARILLAEDSALIRRVARFQVEELQYGVDIVENGAEAVAAVAAGDYELILMDMRMPQMDGLAATRAIRTAEHATGRHITIVALTANVLEGDRDACVDAGMDDFLAKPLQLDALRTVLQRWLPEQT